MKSMTHVLSVLRLRGIFQWALFFFFFLPLLRFKNAAQQDMSNNNSAVRLCTVRNRVNDEAKHWGLLQFSQLLQLKMFIL